MLVSKLKVLAGAALIRLARLLSVIGERVCSERLVYNPLARYGFLRSARHAAPRFSSALRDTFPELKRIIDVGCGEGVFIKQFRSDGFIAEGVEYDSRLRQRAARQGLVLHQFNIFEDAPTFDSDRFDLAISSEVAEHVAPELADRFVDYFREIAEIIVFTAAAPGQGGTGHVNEQPVEYWRQKFALRGFVVDESASHMLREKLRAKGCYPYRFSNLTVFRSSKSL